MRALMIAVAACLLTGCDQITGIRPAAKSCPTPYHTTVHVWLDSIPDSIRVQRCQ